MLEIEQEVGRKGVLILRLKGALTVETTEILQKSLLMGLNENEELQLDGHGLQEIDFFGMQLLCSAHRTSVAWLKLLTWQGGMPERVRAMVEKVGFARQHGCSLCPDDVDCMWLCNSKSCQ